MSAAQWDITLEQGATFDKTLTWQDSSTDPATAINLTGYTAKMEIRKKYTDAAAQVTLTHASGITLGGAAGTIRIILSNTFTSSLPADFSGVYDLELTSGAGIVTRLVQGSVSVSPEATK